MATVMGDTSLFIVGDTVRYYYRGFGPSWIGSHRIAEVIKVNKKSVKCKFIYNKEDLIYNINPLELTKI